MRRCSTTTGAVSTTARRLPRASASSSARSLPSVAVSASGLPRVATGPGAPTPPSAESGDPWLLKARAHLQKGAGLQLLLGKGTDVFSVRDSMIAYAFAIYLIEGHDQVAARFVAVHTKTADVDRACREVLGMPRTVVEARLVRWLDEVTFSERAAAARKAAAKAKKKPAPKKK